jgi:hypothetical protein
MVLRLKSSYGRAQVQVFRGTCRHFHARACQPARRQRKYLVLRFS